MDIDFRLVLILIVAALALVTATISPYYSPADRRPFPLMWVVLVVVMVILVLVTVVFLAGDSPRR
jgi:hypothetical protein